MPVAPPEARKSRISISRPWKNGTHFGPEKNSGTGEETERCNFILNYKIKRQRTKTAIMQFFTPIQDITTKSQYNKFLEGNNDLLMKKFIKRLIKPIYLIYKDEIAKRKAKNKVRYFLKNQKEILLEIGSRKRRDGWITIDTKDGCDIIWDLRNRIPFPDESVSILYSSHFFEHLSFKQGQRFLDECLRVLRPGGKFSICVPNARIYIEAYLSNADLDANTFPSIYEPAYNETTRIDYVNYIAYMDGHHNYMFDEENLIYILKSKGMRNVRLREFSPSLDLEVRDWESIYAEAEK
jgi:predicted SAM-dependent methyltransferase